jgi:hypothetical protein
MFIVNKFISLVGIINCLFGVVLIFTPQINGQEKGKDKINTVEFCELIKKPKDYDQKTIRVAAIYRYGSEYSEIYCLSCHNNPSVWLEYGKSFTSLTKSKIRRRLKASERGKTINVVAVGRIESSGGYGHLSKYKYQFVVDYLESAEVIFNDSPIILPLEIQKKANCSAEEIKKAKN